MQLQEMKELDLISELELVEALEVKLATKLARQGDLLFKKVGEFDREQAPVTLILGGTTNRHEAVGRISFDQDKKLLNVAEECGVFHRGATRDHLPIRLTSGVWQVTTAKELSIDQEVRRVAD